nr:hypothetical protein [uncultured Chitinophaga sp.]
MRKKLVLLSMVFALWITGVMAQTKATDYLNVPGPLHLNDASFQLAWSAHPNNNYYKQEYLVAGETLEKFHALMTIDFLQGNYEVVALVNQKVEELKKMQVTNPLVNYNVYEKDQQYILDFLISQNTADGKAIAVVERNVYRYQQNTHPQQPGIALLAASERAYGADIEAFLKKLKADKMKLINAVAAYKVPAISVR